MTVSPVAWSFTSPRTAPVVLVCALATPPAARSRPAAARIEALVLNLMAFSPESTVVSALRAFAGRERHDGRLGECQLAARDVRDARADGNGVGCIRVEGRVGDQLDDVGDGAGRRVRR